MAGAAVQLGVRVIQREARLRVVIETRDREAGRLTAVTARAVRAAAARELTEVHIGVAVRTVATRRALAAPPGRAGRMQAGVAGCASRPGVCPLQRETRPLAVLKARAGQPEAALVVTARAAAPTLDLLRQTGVLESPGVRIGVTARALRQIAVELLVDLAEAGALALTMTEHALGLGVGSVERKRGPEAVIKALHINCVEGILLVAAGATETSADGRRQAGRVKAPAVRILVAGRAGRGIAGMQIGDATEASSPLIRLRGPRVAGLAIQGIVRSLKREAGPRGVVELAVDRREARGVMTERAAARRWRRAVRGPALHERAIMGVRVAGLALQRRARELTHAGLFGVAERAVERLMTPGQREGRPRVGIQVEAMRVKLVLGVAAETAALLIGRTIELAGVRIIVTARALRRGAPREALSEARVAALGVTRGAGQLRVRRLERESARRVLRGAELHGRVAEGGVLLAMTNRALAAFRQARCGQRQGSQEALAVRRLVAVGTAAPGDLGLRVAQRSDRVRPLVLVTGRAVQTAVRGVQREARVVREVREIVEGMHLPMALLAGAQHRAFVRVVVAGRAILHLPEEARLPFRKHRDLGQRMAVLAIQRFVPTVEIEGN